MLTGLFRLVICFGLICRTALAFDTFQYCEHGVSYDFEDCSNDNVCNQMQNDGSVESCGYYARRPCFCSSNSECLTSDNCFSEDACVKLLPNARKSYCESCESIYYREPRPIFVDSDHYCSTPSSIPAPYQAPILRDDTFDSCTSTEENCVATCSELTASGELSYCSDSAACFCAPLNNECDFSEECLFGEACVQFDSTSVTKYCVSCSAIAKGTIQTIFVDSTHACEGGTMSNISIPGVTDGPNPGSTDPQGNPEQESTSPSGPSESGSESGVCVGVQHLSHVPKHQLVYSEHRRALVYCDTYNSCATPGHIVLYKGSAVMMKTYCQIYDAHHCQRKFMFVNSPRMARNVRLTSYSPDLVFTAMSARYETSIEAAFLKILFRTAI